MNWLWRIFKPLKSHVYTITNDPDVKAPEGVHEMPLYGKPTQKQLDLLTKCGEDYIVLERDDAS
jgi:hypothetical protein